MLLPAFLTGPTTDDLTASLRHGLGSLAHTATTAPAPTQASAQDFRFGE
jgi:hypothetical protein